MERRVKEVKTKSMITHYCHFMNIKSYKRASPSCLQLSAKKTTDHHKLLLIKTSSRKDSDDSPPRKLASDMHTNNCIQSFLVQQNLLDEAHPFMKWFGLNVKPNKIKCKWASEGIKSMNYKTTSWFFTGTCHSQQHIAHYEATARHGNVRVTSQGKRWGP